MGRGGKRPGAGRPKGVGRPTVAERKRLETLVNPSEEHLLWYEDSVIGSVCSGERAAHKFKALMERFAILADVCEVFQIDDIGEESPLSEKEKVEAMEVLLSIYSESQIAQALQIPQRQKRRPRTPLNEVRVLIKQSPNE